MLHSHRMRSHEKCCSVAPNRSDVRDIICDRIDCHTLSAHPPPFCIVRLLILLHRPPPSRDLALASPHRHPRPLSSTAATVVAVAVAVISN